MNIISRKIDGLTIGQRDSDGYVNATAMCQGASKRIQDYWDNKGTKSFLHEVSEITGISVNTLVESRKGRGLESGTWVHPQVAINLGQWCSPKFAALVSKWVLDWMMISVQGQRQTGEPIQLTPHQEARTEGKLARRRYTDAIKDYLNRHEELSEDSRYWMYVNASDAINRVVFGKTARELCIERGVDRDHLRDFMTTEELMSIKEVESLTQRLIDVTDEHPCKAAREAGSRLVLLPGRRQRGVEGDKKPHRILTPVSRRR